MSPKLLSANEVFHFKQAGIDLNLSVMAIGATIGITYAVERMSITNGGRGGRIITTASAAGLIVRTHLGKGGAEMTKQANNSRNLPKEV